MNYKELHTYILEKKFGYINGDIIKQDKNIRIIHLKDEKGISRTLGIVKFLNTDNKMIEVAHSKILAGGLLGKTLQGFQIDFNKKFIGTLQIKLPDWLKNDFNTQQEIGLAFFSKILVSDDSILNNEFLYSDLIEIVPQDLESLFIGKTKPLSKIDDNLLSLLKAAGLTEIKVRNSYD
ncbi:MAG: hypothetical protein KAJ28_07000 [Flavobacteriaceae bacterium]|nr:hypothetical protein [Flavobacteriaceae bacterium]